MKLSRISVPLALVALALTVLTVVPAAAQGRTFALVWSGAPFGNTATATGTITIDESHLNNPGYNNTNPGQSPSNPFVTALTVTVSGSGAGDGTFGVSDFAFEVLDTHGGTLDLSKELTGQPTSGSAFGTTHDGSSGDFNLFKAAASPNAPTGTAFFLLTTGGGSGAPMYLTRFTPVSAGPTAPVGDVITFDTLAHEPGPNGFATLAQANGSSTIDGVTFSSNAYVFGRQFSFGAAAHPYVTPASGAYAFVPGTQPVTTLTTAKTLYGLNLGTVDAGDGRPLATHVTVSAVDAGGQALGAVDAVLTGPRMSFLDTSVFASLSGIAGYTLTSEAGLNGLYDYAADDFTFSPPVLKSVTIPSPVPAGTVVTAAVALDRPTASDVVVGLSPSDSSVVRVHRAVVIPAGSASATFTINTYRSYEMQTVQIVTIQASLGQAALTRPLTITAR